MQLTGGKSKTARQSVQHPKNIYDEPIKTRKHNFFHTEKAITVHRLQIRLYNRSTQKSENKAKKQSCFISFS
jgi:hypothetical protein